MLSFLYSDSLITKILIMSFFSFCSNQLEEKPCGCKEGHQWARIFNLRKLDSKITSRISVSENRVCGDIGTGCISLRVSSWLSQYTNHMKSKKVERDYRDIRNLRTSPVLPCPFRSIEGFRPEKILVKSLWWDTFGILNKVNAMKVLWLEKKNPPWI